MLGFLLILYLIFFQQAASIHIQMPDESIQHHIHLYHLSQLSGTALPFTVLGGYDLPAWGRMLLPKLILCMVETPHQAFLILAQIQPLLLLVSVYHLQSRVAFFEP